MAAVVLPATVLPFATPLSWAPASSSLPAQTTLPRALSAVAPVQRVISPAAKARELQPQTQLNPWPKRFDAGPAKSAPVAVTAAISNIAKDAVEEQKLVDPFFYPTTVSPLTGAAALQTSSPQKTGSPEQLFARPATTITGSTRLTSAQNLDGVQDEASGDPLAIQMQALEYAKSLAAMQSSQALQKVRARQEQLRREAEQAKQSFKDMEAECALPTPSLPDAVTQQTESKASDAASQDIAEKPLWSQDIWSNAPTGLPSKTQPQMSSGSSAAIVHERSGVAAHSSATAGARQATPPRQISVQSPDTQSVPASRFQSAASQAMPPFSVPPNDISVMANRILTAHNTPSLSAALGGSAMLPQAPMSPPRSSYVDAMGNPLALTSAREFPNIKDEMPSRLPDLRQGFGGSVGSFQEVQASATEQLVTALEPQVSRPSPQDDFDKGPGQLAMESELLPFQTAQLGITSDASVATAVVHEKSLPAGRAQRAEVIDAPTSQPDSASVAEPAVAAEPVTAATSTQPQQQIPTVGAADAAAGSAPPPPAAASRLSSQGEGSASVPAKDVSQRVLRRDRSAPKAAPKARESGARSRQRGSTQGTEDRPERPPRPAAKVPPKRASSSSPAPAPAPAPAPEETPSEESVVQKLSNLPPNASEELQAELEECLDMIRWCGESVTRESLKDLTNTSRPPLVVSDVLVAVALLIGQPETKWDKLKKLITNPTFVERVQKLSFQQVVTRDTFRKLRDCLQRPDFDEEQIKSVCVPVVPLAMWCRAIGVYLSKTKFRGGPEIRPAAGAGASSPAPPTRQVERLATPESYMIFEPDLRSMSPEELTCVPNLTISRPNVGSICFHGSTDCTYLDFERVVRLEIGEVLVYPDSSLKPPVGVDLNKPATVTMYQCWPPTGSKLLQDEKSQERYRNKIKSMTEEKLAKFLDYDCITGIWEFAVDHF